METGEEKEIGGGELEMHGEMGRATVEDSEFGFPYWIAVRRRIKPYDPFFAAGNVERELLAKHFALDLTEDERNQLQIMEDVESEIVFCPIVGCRAPLKYLEDFEDHYRARHTASCSVCSRVYPTSRLLSIHISEAHDSFFQAKVARGFPMYECLVEGCGAKLKSYQSRQQHLVDKHKFPTSFEFFKKSRLSKQQRHKHHRKHAGGNQSEGMRDRDMDVKEKNSKQKHLKFQTKQAGYKREEMETQMEEEEKNSEQHHSKCPPELVGYGAEETREGQMEVEQKMADLVSAVSKLSTSDSTPSSISFGRRHARGFSLLPRSVQRNKKHFDPADAKG